MKLKVGVVSFSDPRNVKGIEASNRRDLQEEEELSKYLASQGVKVIRALPGELVRSRKKSEEASAALLAADVDCIVAGCWKWTDPMLAVDVVRRTNRPVMLYGGDAPDRTALGCIVAVGAALWEIAPNAYAARHARIIGNPDAALSWIRGMGALARMRRASLLLWGGSYCLKMAHLDDDPSKLKSFLVGDILVEDQYELIATADKILSRQKSRVNSFLKWLQKNGASIVHDRKMATPQSIERQVALYLAARDLLKSYEGENVEGVSIKCQPTLSERYGVTGCMLPAFLPFGEDSEGKRPVIAATCEGDIKGLITSMLLQYISGGTPAGFGDIRTLDVDGRRMLLISNCGAASVYYAGVSPKASKVLPRVCLRAQCQGAGGCAVGYMGPAFGESTIARLARRDGAYRLQWAVGDSVDVTETMRDKLGWGDTWPLSLFDIGINMDHFVRTIASNHYSFIPGDVSASLLSICETLGIETERLSTI